MSSDLTDGKADDVPSAPIDQNETTGEIASAEADVEREVRRNPDRQ
jgi:hypothetical protein